ncbi:MAG: thermonuclease family protein [Rhizobiales bacterium]|nr:thermonuclease family protein [Hyphomicrobiales bacterium]
MGFEHLALADIQGPARIVDGDTLEIAGRKVRLLDIDAPEDKQRCADANGQRYDCGTLATEHIRQLIGSRPVRCEGSKRDRYRRLLAICYVGNFDLGRVSFRLRVNEIC